MKYTISTLGLMAITALGCASTTANTFDSGPQLFQKNGQWNKYYQVRSDKTELDLLVIEELGDVPVKINQLAYSENNDGSCKSIGLLEIEYKRFGEYDVALTLDKDCDGKVDFMYWKGEYGETNYGERIDNEQFGALRWEEWDEKFINEMTTFDEIFNIGAQVEMWHKRK